MYDKLSAVDFLFAYKKNYNFLFFINFCTNESNDI